MSFIFKWMRIDRPFGVGLHPSRTVDVNLAPRDALERCRTGIEGVLGGTVRHEDVQHGELEAAFGLIFSERLTCAVTQLEEGRSRIAIESRQGAHPTAAPSSLYVEALARYLMTEEPK